MRYSKLFLLLICLSFTAKAQFAIINDADGFVNVRKAKNAKSEITGRINSGDLVLYFDEDRGKEWIWISHSDANFIDFASSRTLLTSKVSKANLTGYVHRSRLVLIEDLPKADYKKGIGYLIPNGAKSFDTIVFSFRTKPFNLKSHVLLKVNDNCVGCKTSFISKIDGNKPWGIDGNVPKVEIANFLLTVNRHAVVISLKAYNDLFEPGSVTSVKYDHYGNIYLYIPNNSDGAGGYSVVWIVNNKILTKRYVDSID